MAEKMYFLLRPRRNIVAPFSSFTFPLKNEFAQGLLAKVYSSEMI